MRAARPFLLMLLLVAVIGGGAVAVSLISQDADEPDTGSCPATLVTVAVDGIDVALDDQGPAGTDPCDLTRLGPTPDIIYISYDCRVVQPQGDGRLELRDRIDPIHQAGSCRQPGAAASTTTTGDTTAN